MDGIYHLSFRSNLDTFVSNCNKLNYYKYVGIPADVTALLDWRDDELESLAQSAAGFVGSTSSAERIEFDKPSHTLSRTPRSFSSMVEYSRKDSICSTSWATSIIEVAETEMNNEVEFSMDQLLRCVPSYFDMESSCIGVKPHDLMEYLTTVGLVTKSNFTSCDEVNNQRAYRFDMVIPEAPNKSGLMKLVATDKPVFVMLALNMVKLRYVKNSDSALFKHGAFQPTMYGIIQSYDSSSETPYWEIVTHPLPIEEISIKLPMTESETDANFGGIAAYAFTLQFKEITHVYKVDESMYPTIESIPADAISLEFKEGSYSNLEYADFSRFTELEVLVFGEYSFQNAIGANISCPKLKHLIFCDYSFSKILGAGSRRLRDEQQGLLFNKLQLESFAVGKQ